ncbi:hypothetical protein Y032_0470g2032 [Ancylostoma ceylanicum]|uniref:Uncharacterized protein n=1 Tax=Ancylostoma ceylanicum TaxID=53326 RepID=A0A016WWX1_9BILA|nr:hypothetical protein Y032_0470g2032 [Ancylostoma ceylanicum]
MTVSSFLSWNCSADTGRTVLGEHRLVTSELTNSETMAHTTCDQCQLVENATNSAADESEKDRNENMTEVDYSAPQ